MNEVGHVLVIQVMGSGGKRQRSCSRWGGLVQIMLNGKSWLCAILLKITSIRNRVKSPGSCESYKMDVNQTSNKTNFYCLNQFFIENICISDMVSTIMYNENRIPTKFRSCSGREEHLGTITVIVVLRQHRQDFYFVVLLNVFRVRCT
jgi:hypothetical protein